MKLVVLITLRLGVLAVQFTSMNPGLHFQYW